MKRGIPASHAKVMQAHDTGAVLPQIGITQCSPACIFYAWCRNFENLELCKGFKLIENGKNTQHIMRTLGKMDKLYVENSIKDLPKFKSENQEVILRDVIRILEPSSGRFIKEESTTKLGFRGMLDSISPSEPEEVQPKVVVRGFGRGFIGMLDEMSETKRGNESKPIIRSFRTNKEEEPESLDFRAMLDKISKPTLEESPPEPIMRGFGRGFSGMIDELNRDRTFSETPATYTRKPVHRSVPLGFRGMIDEFNRGTEEEEEELVRFSTFRGVLADLSRRSEQESEEKRMKGHNVGFKAMLDGAFPIDNPIHRRRSIDPIWRKLQREIHAILNER